MTNLAINTAPTTGAEVVNLDWVGAELFTTITGIPKTTLHNRRQKWQKMGLNICQLLPHSKSYVYSLRNFYQWCDKLSNENSLKASASEKTPSKSTSSTTTANGAGLPCRTPRRSKGSVQRTSSPSHRWFRKFSQKSTMVSSSSPSHRWFRNLNLN